jgi:tetratricopeptide (TPR) repeat protein
MKSLHALRSIALGTLLALSGLAQAAGPEEMVRPIQDRWAEIKYRLPEKEQADQYHVLAQEARKLAESNPNAPEPLVWEGIVLSTEAGAKGGIGALSLAKEARKRLEEALKLNDKALAGSAYTSLATLYAQVPGWPVGFGDKERAEKYFKASLAINPEGIDPNFFYGEYLVGRDRLNEARAHLETALKAPPRPGRELADSGRRQEIQALLKKIQADPK